MSYRNANKRWIHKSSKIPYIENRSRWKSFAVLTDHMLPGVQITAGLGFFLCSGRVSDSEDSNSLLL